MSAALSAGDTVAVRDGRRTRRTPRPGSGSSVTSSATPARTTRRRPVAGTGRDIGTPSGWTASGGGALANPARSTAGLSTRPGQPIVPAPRPPTYPRPMTSGATDPVSTSRRWGAQSMTAPLREVLVKAPGPAFGGGVPPPRRRLPAPGRPRRRASRARRPRRAARPARRRRPPPRRRDRRPGPRLRVRPTAHRRRRRDPAPARQAQPCRRARRPRGMDPRARHPDPRADRGAGHARGRRHVLAPPGPAVHRAHAAHERRRRTAARGARGRRRPDLRRAVLARPRRARPPAVGHLAGRGRRWRSCSCRCCRWACTRCSSDLGIRLVEVPEEEYPTLGCNVLAVRPGVVVTADGNHETRRRLEAAGVEVHAIPLGEVGENGSGGVTCLTRPVLRA